MVYDGGAREVLWGETIMTDEELAVLLTDLESDRVERKRSASDRREIQKNICAFANDLPGHGKAGVILIGIEDDGRCARIQVTDQMLRELSQMRNQGGILPLPSITVQRHAYAEGEVAVVIVEPSQETPVRCRGEVWVKVGPTVQSATPEEERRLTERRRAADLPFDLRPAPYCTLDDLDLTFFRSEYLPRAVAPEVLKQNRRSVETQLASLRFLTAGCPNYGAILILGRDPLARVPGGYVQFRRINGTKLTDPSQDQKQVSGPLSQLLKEMDDLLKINLSTALDVTGGLRDVRHPDYPVEALQQLTRNAILHRSYEGTNAPVRVSWYSDRIEIHSPGGLYGQINPQNFGMGPTDYRNPLMAEAMFHLGFIQKFGMGISMTKEALAKNGNPPPEFQFQPTSVLVTVRLSP